MRSECSVQTFILACNRLYIARMLAGLFIGILYVRYPGDGSTALCIPGILENAKCKQSHSVSIT